MAINVSTNILRPRVNDLNMQLDKIIYGSNKKIYSSWFVR